MINVNSATQWSSLKKRGGIGFRVGRGIISNIVEIVWHKSVLWQAILFLLKGEAISTSEDKTNFSYGRKKWVSQRKLFKLKSAPIRDALRENQDQCTRCGSFSKLMFESLNKGVIFMISYIGTKHSRMDRVKFVEDSHSKIWSDMIC